MKLKRTTSILLIAIMVLSYISMAQFTNNNSLAITASAEEAAYSGTCGENLTWTLNPENGELVISGAGDTVSSSAFYNNKTIKRVIFPSTIKKIGTNAFNSCFSLEKISFQEPLINELVIETGAFHACHNLNEVNLPEGLTAIYPNAFSNCSSLKSVIIPASVTSLGTYCFFECGALETVEFAEGSQLKRLGSDTEFGPFSRCYSLKNITLPQSVEEIGWGTFSGCTSLETINIPKNAKNVSYMVADGYYAEGAILSLKEITVDPENESCLLDENGSLIKNVKNGVSLIAAPNREGMKTLKIMPYNTLDINFFRYVTDIDKIEVAEGVDGFTVDENGILFNEDKTCLLKYPAGRNAEEFMIPASVTSIYDYAFFGAENLKSFTVEEGNTAFIAEDGVLYNTEKTTIIAYPLGKTNSEFEIISSVNQFNPISLHFAKHIEKFTVASGNEIFESDDDGVLYLKNDNGSKSLYLYPAKKESSEYTVKNDVTIINIDAFYNSAVEELNIPKSVSLIGSSFFMIKKLRCINYEGESLFENIRQANRLLSVSNVNNSAELSSRPEDETISSTGTDIATNITYSYENGCFDYDGDIEFEVITKSKDDYKEAFRGYANESDDMFFYEIKFYSVDDSQNRIGEIQPAHGKKIKIGFPIPKEYENANPKLFMVIHNRSDNNKTEFFIEENGNIEVKNGYVYIWADNFSPFALVINYKGNIKTVASISIATLPSKTSYTYKNGNLDLSGLALTLTYSDGTTETVTDTSKMKVTGFDNSKTGSQTITVEYEDATASFDITVSYAWWQWIIRILLLGFLWY